MRKLRAFLGALLVLCAAGCSNYDSVHPDTKSNRKLFTSLTGVKADKSIREVYVYADEFPYIDADYCLAFKATPEAVARIVKKNRLEKKDREKDKFLWEPGFSPHPPRSWWNAEERNMSDLYHKDDEKHREFYSLWHDPKTGKCQCLVVYL